MTDQFAINLCLLSMGVIGFGGGTLLIILAFEPWRQSIIERQEKIHSENRRHEDA